MTQEAAALAERFAKVLDTLAATGEEWAIELRDATETRPVEELSSYLLVSSAKGYIEHIWGAGENRLQRIDALNEAEAKAHLRKMLAYIESLADEARVLAIALVERRKSAATKAARKAVAAKLQKDAGGKLRVMAEIQSEWVRRRNAGTRLNATTFAKEMNVRYGGVVTVEGIKNAQTRWAKAYHPSR
ncbi:hypothetical protein [Noviluteimonas gilva]|uniref:Uncharacterized protein n=1 Tax=Noviluteimonas gilva TaxID=2682097 RepID=A0A7C9M1X4_9GAMM|nr:hypothetical protein [Lysobacter gilvus]MUV14688.1 hypothetical protein [Lysobacter gilvus]